MPRPLTAERVDQIRTAHDADPEAIGPLLGVMIMEGNLPVDTIAKMLVVSEPTVYRWMYGETIPRDPDKIRRLNRLVTLLLRVREADELYVAKGSSAERTQAFVQLITRYRATKTQ